MENTQTTTEQAIIDRYKAHNIDLVLNIGANGKPAAKATKPSPKSRLGIKYLFNYYYSTEERRAQAIEAYIANIERWESEKKERKEKRKELNETLKAADHFKKGDILENTWGYEQTNVEFYKVLEVKNKSLVVVEIGQIIEENSMYSHGMACNVLPDTTSEEGKPFILRIKADERGQVWICNPAKHYYFKKWDGRPSYKSWYA